MSTGNQPRRPGPVPGQLTMDFFQNQENAKRRTGLLIFLYAVAVLLIILAVYLVTGIAAAIFLGEYLEGGGGNMRDRPGGSANPLEMTLFNWKFIVGVAGSVLLVIGGTMIGKIVELRQGGAAVAGMLGGLPVRADTQDQNERKLINIVEEMSIASGTPPPALFILPEAHSINAFAAGYVPGDAAIGVTRGAIENLTRDELQGVIAHEFSHILNGDMRINIRLIGVMHGILAVAVVGGAMMRGAYYASLGSGGRSRGSSSRDSKGGGAALALLALGLALFIIGSIGVLFSRLIKAAVSRQREFLADAAAVQFTRNPHGIAGALRKIGGISGNSRVKSKNAEEASHMFFGEALSNRLNSTIGLLSTHPPLEKRIRAIDPGWDGTFPKMREPEVRESLRTLQQPRPGAPGAKPSAAQLPLAQVRPDQVLASIGTMNPQSLLIASALLESLGDDLRQRVHTGQGAQSVIFALLLQEDEEAARGGAGTRRELLPPGLLPQIQSAFQQAGRLEDRARLPLVELCLPALKELDRGPAMDFLSRVRKLIEADDQKTVFEFAVWKILERHLDPAAVERHRRAPQYLSLSGIKPQLTVLLSALAWTSGRERGEAEAAFGAAVESLGTSGQGMSLIPPERCTIQNLSRVCDVLVLTTPHIKKRVLTACAHCVLADEQVTVSELELLRAVAETLDCPMPPLDPGELGGGTADG